MRKTTSILFILFCIFSLPAQQVVSSNSIGQDRGRFSLDGEYTLLIDDGSSTLFYQDEALWKKSIQRTQEGVELSTLTFSDSSIHRKRYDENNRLTAEEEGEKIEYFYYDEKGLMSKSTTLISGKLSAMELYSYDEGSKALSSILTITQKGNNISYFGSSKRSSWFSFTEDDLFTKVIQLPNNLQIQQRWKGNEPLKAVEVAFTQEGGIRLTSLTKEGEVSELYNDAGLLEKRTTPTLTTLYSYSDDRTLLEENETGLDGYKRIIRYEEGRTLSEIVYQRGVVEKETLFSKERGKVETLYDKGIPYCDITYALDGVRVLSIRYR